MMRENSIYQQAKKEYSNRNYDLALSLFQQAVMKGNQNALKYVAIIMIPNIFFEENLTANELGKIFSYLRSGLIYEKNVRICIKFAALYRLSRHIDPERSFYYIDLARREIKPEDKEILLPLIEDEDEMLDGLFPSENRSQSFNDLDYFWAVMKPFWIERYHKHPATKAILDKCSSEVTLQRFNSCKSEVNFEQYTSKWLNSQKKEKLYLIYVERDLSKSEIIDLISETMKSYGYEVEYHEWKTINYIPDDVIVGVLGDSAFLAESHKNEKAIYYQHIQNHAKQKVWIPWGIPEDISYPENWNLLPDEWQCWIPLKTSLLEEPLQTLESLANIMENPDVGYFPPNFTIENQFSFKKFYFKEYMSSMASNFSVLTATSFVALIIFTSLSFSGFTIPSAVFVAAGVLTTILFGMTCSINYFRKEILESKEAHLNNLKNTSFCCLLWRKITNDKLENFVSHSNHL